MKQRDNEKNTGDGERLILLIPARVACCSRCVEQRPPCVARVCSDEQQTDPMHRVAADWTGPDAPPFVSQTTHAPPHAGATATHPSAKSRRSARPPLHSAPRPNHRQTPPTHTHTHTTNGAQRWVAHASLLHLRLLVTPRHRQTICPWSRTICCWQRSSAVRDAQTSTPNNIQCNTDRCAHAPAAQRYCWSIQTTPT